MAANPLYAIAEYLRLERQAEERHEYLDGFIYAMAGESGAHADLSMNLNRIVSTALLGSSCRARAKDTKVRSGPLPQWGFKGLFSYPDLVVICGEPQYSDKYQDIVLNPTVIFEVLSDSTEAFDRGAKFLRYQTWSPTLTDYVLVSQSAPIIEHFIRQADGSWSYHVYQGLDQSFVISSINCTLRLAEVYDRVDFPAGEVDEPLEA